MAARTVAKPKAAHQRICYWLVACRRSDASSIRVSSPTHRPPRRCARRGPSDVHYDGEAKDPGLCDLVEPDGWIISGGEFERSCDMSGRSEDVLGEGRRRRAITRPRQRVGLREGKELVLEDSKAVRTGRPSLVGRLARPMRAS
jgi:hypothetical protein